MKKIIICADQRRKEVARALAVLKQWLGKEVEVVDHDVRAEVPLDEEADLLVVLGGDGAILATARKLGGRRLPVLCVNLGRLGFLTELLLNELEEVLPDLLAGKCRYKERLMLECELHQEQQIRHMGLALNDVVISGAAPARMAQVTLAIDEEVVTTYSGDGVIVATPVGSTAYALSAGGPILEPHLEALVVVPICAHSLTNRPLVVPSSSVIKLRVQNPPSGMSVTLDGQVFAEITPEVEVVVSASAHKLLLVETGQRTFYGTLRSKLNWGGEPRYAKR